MKKLALLCAGLIGIPSQDLLGSELLIWGASQDVGGTKLVFPLPETKNDGVIKLCPTGLNQPSVEKRGAIIVNSDQSIIAVGAVSSNLIPPTGLKHVIDVAVGFNHAIALTADGSTLVWGDEFLKTNDVPYSLSNIVQVAAGIDSCMALSSNGFITYWSRGGTSRLWKGAKDVASISVAQDFLSGKGMALKRDGSVLQWHRQTMATPVGGISNIVAIAPSPAHCLLLSREGGVMTLGWNGDRITPPPGLTNIIAIAAGYEHVGAEATVGFNLALRNDGNVFGWRQPGQGNNGIVSPGISNVVAIAAGEGFWMAITTNRSVAEQFRRHDLQISK